MQARYALCVRVCVDVGEPGTIVFLLGAEKLQQDLFSCSVNDGS